MRRGFIASAADFSDKLEKALNKWNQCRIYNAERYCVYHQLEVLTNFDYVSAGSFSLNFLPYFDT